MKSIIILIIFNVLIVSNLIGQCIIRGKVSDKNGETLVGANVYIKNKMSSAVTTDLNGDYSIKLTET